MSKLLYASGISGIVSISEGDANINNPLSNLNKIYFHSSLDYLKIRNVVTGTLSLPQRVFSRSDASSAFGNSIYNVHTHNLGYVPLVYGRIQNTSAPLVGDTLIQEGGTCNIRSLVVGSDSVAIYIREVYVNKDTTYPAISIPYTIYVFENTAT